MEEKNFVCKFCSKKFSRGKSLGGHIRIHMNEYSAQQNGNEGSSDLVKLASFDGGRKRKRESVSSEATADAAAAAGNYDYGLRENPKRAMRFSDSNAAPAPKAKFCKECGKGFASLKALCGHMACHSEKERGSNKLSENSGTKEKVVMDSQSDTETSTPTHPRRSKRMKLKPFHAQPSSMEQEQEEGAKCLLLLSKNSSYRSDRLNSIADSSENSSVLLEVKLKSAEIAMSGDSNSQYFLSGYNSESNQSGKNITRGNHSESSNKLFKDLEFDRREGTMKEYTNSSNTHCKKIISCLNNEEVHGRFITKNVNSCYDTSTDSDSFSVPLKQKLSINSKKKKLSSKKIKGHECPICYKIFRSGQALGGHKRSHFIGGSEENAALVIKQDTPHVQCLIDLNLPAPFDE